MESKVKALKVAELRDALNKAGVTFPPKTNKADLVVKVLSSPDALVALGLGDAPSAAAVKDDADDLLAPPPEFDWDESADGTTDKLVGTKPATTAATTKSTKPASTAASAAKSAPPAAPAKQAVAVAASVKAEATAATTAAADEEEEKRKKRAERFGIPFVPAPAHVPATTKTKNAAKTKTAAGASQTIEDQDKLKERAKRFGKTTSPATAAAPAPATTKGSTKPAAGKKRPSEAVVDPEEEERRQKRAARFGLPVATTS